jgi:hypothetical protein
MTYEINPRPAACVPMAMFRLSCFYTLVKHPTPLTVWKFSQVRMRVSELITLDQALAPVCFAIGLDIRKWLDLYDL